MENPDENIRLERKTREKAVLDQAVWAGIKPGMRVLDAGCGPGKTTSILRRHIQPGGSIVGVDYSEKRIEYAKKKYGGNSNIDFFLHDIRLPMDNMGMFDAIWVRFVLEYNRDESFKILQNLSSNLKSGGCMCVIDLDYNCLTHYHLPPTMEVSLSKIAAILEERHNFDPYIGRKLFSYLYDLAYEKIKVDVRAHHLFYGGIEENDVFNWRKKMEMAASVGKESLDEHPGGASGFIREFMRFLLDPRRFTYTPMILCKGIKPA
ncbi:MAG: class I SAM-dependent methyltransferase [Deltaproteobacteria bacterium]|nr:class I SAM-dependent methyltransferase [Deltaproteobacteria bacterium]